MAETTNETAEPIDRIDGFCDWREVGKALSIKSAQGIRNAVKRGDLDPHDAISGNRKVWLASTVKRAVARLVELHRLTNPGPRIDGRLLRAQAVTDGRALHPRTIGAQRKAAARATEGSQREQG